MTGINKGSIESLSDDIVAMATDLRCNTGLQVLYTGLLINKYVNKRAKKNGPNRSRLEIMQALVTHGGTLKPSELSKMMFRSKQTITKIVDGLERDGMVKREPIGKDRRSRAVTITRKGVDSVKENLPGVFEASNTAVASLSQEETEELNDIMRRIRRHLMNLISDSSSKE